MDNWLWLRDLSRFLNDEYVYRYDKEVNHKSYDVISSLPLPNIKRNGFTKLPQSMPEYCKSEDVVQAYRKYYINEKRDIVKWTKREEPDWYEN